MASYTANYRLHQWEPEDHFLRTDFNGDFAKIDAAIKSVSTAAAASDAKAQRALDNLEPLSYNLYSLLLQSYYDGRYTGYKKALVFDGFRDDSLYGSRSGALLRGKDRLILTATGQTDISLGYGSNVGLATDLSYSQDQTLSYNGAMTGWTIKVKSPNRAVTVSVTYQVLVNGAAVRTGTIQVPADTTPAEFTYTLPARITLAVGDVVRLTVQGNSSELQIYHTASGRLGGVLRFSPVTGTTGQHTSSYVALPARSKIVGWVRYDGCSVTMDVLSGGRASAMTAGEQRRIYTLDKSAYCYETAFALDSPPDGATLAFRLNLTLTSGSSRGQIFDYGVAVL